MNIRACILILVPALPIWALPVTAEPIFAWSANYGGISSVEYVNTGQLAGIALTADGNVVTAGHLTVAYPEVRLHVWKHRPDGSLLWSFDDSGLNTGGTAGLSVDAQGNIFCAAWIGTSIGGSIVIVKLTAAGVQSWRKVFDGGTGGAEKPVAVLADGTGGAYVAGRSGLDALLVRFDSKGGVQWEQRYDGEAHGSDELLAMTAVDGGDVAVCGFTTSAAGGRNSLTIRYSPDGAVRWTHVGNGGVAKLAILADAGGDVFVGGETGGSVVVLRLSSGGALQWSQIVSISDQSHLGSPGFRGMALDGLGKPAIASSSISYILPGEPWMWESCSLTCLSADGTFEWQAGLASQEFFGAPAIDSVIGLPGGGYVAGGAFSAAMGRGRSIVSVGSGGSRDWAVSSPRYTQVGPGPGLVSHMAVGNDGQLYVGGRDSSSGVSIEKWQTGPPPWAPSVVTNLDAINSGGTNSALAGGSVRSNNLATTWWFDYGTTTAYGSQTAPESLAAGGTGVLVSKDLTGLSPGTKYYYRLVATNSAGTSFGNNVTFTTRLSVPAWRTHWFGGTAVPGSGAQDDPDNDGLTNQLEYAFAGNPLKADAPALPVAGRHARLYNPLPLYPTLTFTWRSGITDVSYYAELSNDLQNWTSTRIAVGSSTPGIAVENTGGSQYRVFALGQEKYMRVRVTGGAW